MLVLHIVTQCIKNNMKLFDFFLGILKKEIIFAALFETRIDLLAQLVEHLPFKQRVPSSSLGRITGI